MRIVAADDWPEGYDVYDGAKSPDKRYGILVPSVDAWEKDESLEETNYLADLKNHRLLGKIAGADYFRSQNHRGLEVKWRMNEVYMLVRLMVPAARFATIKREQVAWLKTRDAAHSIEGKSKLTENRIRALQDLLW